MTSMSDNICLTHFANGAAKCWNTHFRHKNGSLDQGVSMLMTTVNEVLKMCEVPCVRYQNWTDAPDNFYGAFFKHLWLMKLNYKRFSNIESMDHFLTLTEAVYHEFRHAEQHWLIIRMIAAGISNMSANPSEALIKKRDALIQNTSVVLKDITSYAWQMESRKPFVASEKMRGTIRGWYRSAYTHHFNYAVALMQIKENPFLDTDEERQPHFNRAYHQYRYSDHEADAHDIASMARTKLQQLLMAGVISSISTLTHNVPSPANLSSMQSRTNPMRFLGRG